MHTYFQQSGDGTLPLPSSRGKTVKRVCVIGAGVVGLSTAVRILEESKRWFDSQSSSPGGGVVEVTVVADRFSPHTTSDGSGGFWSPYEFGSTSPLLIRKWGGSTWQHMYQLAMSADGSAGAVGAQFVSGYKMFDSPTVQEPFYKDQFWGYRHMTPKELEMFPAARSGYFCTSMLLNVQKYLPWLMQRFKDAGGKTEFGKVENLSQVAEDYDVVVNCCGPRASQLVDDPHALPIRGQTRRVRAPWIKHFYLYSSEKTRTVSYILPVGEEILVGGVAQPGNWKEEVDQGDSDMIWTNAQTVFPFLKNAPTIREWAGLRPGRSTVRLEAGIVDSPGGRRVPVIHNYGQGGSGVALHWGCAADAAHLVLTALHLPPPPTHNSKL